MTALWTAATAAAATGGQVTGDWIASGVSIDTRTILPGDLFVALDGESRDGHEFAAAALAKGASALLVRRLPADVPPTSPRLMVPDTLRALEALGTTARRRSEAKIVGITGSVGKTGTKEALRHVLASHAKTHASVASYNNHWGVPLSLARMPADAAFGILEMGMNHAGEILPLTRMARPHVAIVTWVTSAHLEFFASEAEIADAKAEIMAGIEPGGAVILPLDNPHFPRLRAAAKRHGIERIVTFGEGHAADWRLAAADLGAKTSRIEVEHRGQSLEVHLSAPGRHWAMNSLAVLAASELLGLEPGIAAAALGSFAPPSGRGQRRPLPVRGGQAVLIDESYNGNPASMAAAIEVLGRQPGRRIAALGDMRELGPSAPGLHETLAQPLVHAGVEIVLTCGPLMRLLHDALPATVQKEHRPDCRALLPLILDLVRPGDVLLVKGSLSTGMNAMVKDLLAGATTTEKVG